MAKRTYDQSCGLATALDLLGERWTLLILRNLVLGPQRYTDLLGGLPGIGTNLLANRLRELEALGLVCKRELAPPAASTVYELTADGRELEPAMAALGRWGSRYMELPERLEDMPPRLVVGGLAMSFTPERARPLDGRRYELVVDGMQFELWFDGERAHARQQAAARPDAVIEAELATLMALALGELTPTAARAGELMHVTGDEAAAAELLESIDLSMFGAALRDGAEPRAAASA